MGLPGVRAARPSSPPPPLSPPPGGLWVGILRGHMALEAAQLPKYLVSLVYWRKKKKRAMCVGRKGGCEGREKLPVSRQAMLALQTCGRDSRASPRASGREGKAGWGSLATGLSGSGERLTRRAFRGTGRKAGGWEIPIAKRNEEPNGCVFKLVLSPSFSPRMRGSLFGLEDCGGRVGQDRGWKKLLILHAVVCAGSGSKSAKLGL